MEQLHARTIEMAGFISNLQVQMVAESEGKPGVPALSPEQVVKTEAGPQIQYNLLSNPFKPEPVFNFLLPGTKHRQELIVKANEYQHYLSTLNAGIDPEKVKSLIDPSLFLPSKAENGSDVSLISGLHALQMLNNTILTNEAMELLCVAVGGNTDLKLKAINNRKNESN